MYKNNVTEEQIKNRQDSKAAIISQDTHVHPSHTFVSVRLKNA